MRFYLPFAFCLMIISSTIAQKSKKQVVHQEPKAPKNIIFMIGDGTGLSQISSAFFVDGYKPNYSRFKAIGLSETSSTYKITDSAAGATAFTIGEKTYNGAIGKDKNHQDKELITEKLAKEGMSIGLVATSAITHATPASFYAHVEYRKQQEDIAKFMINADIDFFAGGGRKFFFDRSDSKDLSEDLKKAKFEIHKELDLSFPCKSKKCGFLYADKGMPRMTEGRGDFLSKASMAAIKHLEKSTKGFFLMIEGSQIDWGGHENNAQYLKAELMDFDKTIGVVLDWAEENGETLVVVTADHETGGYSLASKERNHDGKKFSDYSEIDEKFTTGGHTATLVPVFAFGPQKGLFQGVYGNNQIYFKFLEALKK